MHTRNGFIVEARGLRGRYRSTIESGAKLHSQTVAAPYASTMVGEHSTGNAEEPGSCFTADGNIVEAPPNDEEHLGKEVSRVTRGIHPS